MISRSALVCLLALATAIPVAAQSKYRPPTTAAADAPSFGYDGLSLSLSSTYCETHKSHKAPRVPRQCGSDVGDSCGCGKVRAPGVQ